MRFLLLFVISLTGFTPSESFARPLKACITTDGTVIVKKRCKKSKGEQQLDISLLPSTGPQGPAGPTGAAGEQGIPGRDGVLGYEELANTFNQSYGPLQALGAGSPACPTGKIPIAGACEVDEPDLFLWSAYREGAQWLCFWKNSTGSTIVANTTAVVHCANQE